MAQEVQKIEEEPIKTEDISTGEDNEEKTNQQSEGKIKECKSYLLN